MLIARKFISSSDLAQKYSMMGIERISTCSFLNQEYSRQWNIAKVQMPLSKYGNTCAFDSSVDIIGLFLYFIAHNYMPYCRMMYQVSLVIHHFLHTVFHHFRWRCFNVQSVQNPPIHFHCKPSTLYLCLQCVQSGNKPCMSKLHNYFLTI